MARTMSPILTYTVVNLALVAIWVLPMLVLAICAVIMARSKGDAARRFFTLALKITFGLFTLALILYTAYDALAFIYYAYISGYFSYGPSQTLEVQSTRDAMAHLTTVGRFFENLANIFLLVTLVELGNAILTCIGQAGGVLKNVTRIGALAVGFLGFVLDLAEVGKRNAVYNSYNGSTSSSFTIVDYYAGLNVANQLGAAFDIIFFIASIAVIVYSSYVMHKASVARTQKWSASMLLAAAVLDFVRFIWKTAYAAAFTIRLYANFSTRNISITVPMYTRVIDPILNIWFFAVIMILLFVVGTRKVNGLWSNPEAHGHIPTQQYWQPVYQGQPKPAPPGFMPQYAPQNGVQYHYGPPQNGHQQVPGVAPQGGYYQQQPVPAQPVPVQLSGSPAPAHNNQPATQITAEHQ